MRTQNPTADGFAAPSASLSDWPSPSSTVAPRTVQSKELNRVVLASVVGSFVEWFEFSVYGYLAAVLGKVFFATSSPTMQVTASWAAFAIAFFARPIGGIVFGSLGDKYGRKRVLTITIIMMAISTFLIGVLPGYASIGIAAPLLLIVLRLMQGLSAGGEASGAAIFVAEYCRDRNRTLLTSWVEVGCMAGFFFGASISAILTVFFSADQILDWAWRIPFLIALPLGAIGLYIRKYLEETPTFVAMKQQHDALAQASWKVLFATHKKELFQSAGIIIVTNVTLFTVVTYIPTYFVSALHVDVATGLKLSLGPQLFLVVMIPLMGMLADKLSRKTMMTAASLAIAVLAVPCFHLLLEGSTAAKISSLMVLNFCLAMLLGSIYSIIPSMFHTSVRFKGMALSYNVAVAMFAGTAPMINSWLIARTGNPVVPAYYLIGAAVIGLIALVSSRDRTGLPMHGDPVQ